MALAVQLTVVERGVGGVWRGRVCVHHRRSFFDVGHVRWGSWGNEDKGETSGRVKSKNGRGGK